MQDVPTAAAVSVTDVHSSDYGFDITFVKSGLSKFNSFWIDILSQYFLLPNTVPHVGSGAL